MDNSSTGYIIIIDCIPTELADVNILWNMGRYTYSFTPLDVYGSAYEFGSKIIV